MRRTRITPLLLAGSAVLGVLAVGCSDDGSSDTSAGAAETAAVESSDPTFVGEVDGTQAFVGISTEGNSARIYLCDSKGISVWLDGTTANGRLSASSEGYSLAATVDDAAIEGEVTISDGTSHPFVAELAPAGGPAGLYRGEVIEDGTTTSSGGFIVLPDESIRGFIEPESLAAPKSIIAILIGRRSIELPGGGGTLRIVDGTSN